MCHPQGVWVVFPTYPQFTLWANIYHSFGVAEQMGAKTFGNSKFGEEKSRAEPPKEGATNMSNLMSYKQLMISIDRL